MKFAPARQPMKRFAALLLPLLAACANVPDIASSLTPYRIDVRQGNFVTPEMAAQLKPGQTKDQVRFILGTSLLTDPYHADRWDYVYSFTPGHGQTQQRHLAVHFADGKLARVSGDVVANAQGDTKARSQLIDISGEAK